MTDRQTLLALAQQNTPDARSQLAGGMVAFLESEDIDYLSPGERVSVMEILQDIITDTEAEIRAAIAINIQDMPDAPHDLVTFLAKDESFIAKPVIEHSPVLTDEDLIEIVHLASTEHRMAITKREQISPVLCDELVSSGEQSVISSLLDNAHAEIADATYDWLVEEARMISSYRERLVRRGDLPAEAATRLYLWVDWTLRRQLSARYSLDQAQMDKLLDRSVSVLNNEDPAGRGNWTAANRLLSNLADGSVLSNGLMLSALEANHVALFLAHLMKKTGLKRPVLQRALFMNNPESVVIVGRAASMNDPEITYLAEILAKRNGTAGFGGTDPRILTALVRIDSETAAQVVALWCQGKSWLNAQRQAGLIH